MTETVESRVAVYIDFDNIVISRYNQLFGKGQFHLDKARERDHPDGDSQFEERAAEATVQLGAVLDFASSFGTIVLSRAYADWSVPVNAGYSRQLLARAVDLTQLFPTTPWMKNGADIRLAVDVVEDLFRLPDLTHVVIVAGDSDYIALAQRCKRLGRFVVGIGVAGSTSKNLAVACDEFADYDALPGIGDAVQRAAAAKKAAATEKAAAKTATQQAVAKSAKQTKGRSTTAASAVEPEPDDDADTEAEDPQEVATGLLERALRLGHAKDDAEWLHSSAVKIQIKRMDPAFNEKSLGFRSFSDFVTSRSDIVEMKEDGQARRIRLLPALQEKR
ncbi:MAG: NYN domain-containing protein [Microbacteriaceae bacterium]|nr:MAG: NYN domain-containing protein [Microbacteriaceae bacterium]